MLPYLIINVSDKMSTGKDALIGSTVACDGYEIWLNTNNFQPKDYSFVFICFGIRFNKISLFISLPPPPKLVGPLAPKPLIGAEKLFVGQLKGPESMVVEDGLSIQKFKEI